MNTKIPFIQNVFFQIIANQLYLCSTFHTCENAAQSALQARARKMESSQSIDYHVNIRESEILSLPSSLNVVQQRITSSVLQLLHVL